MATRSCVRCAHELADEFRFCPHCGAAQRRKVVEHFRGHAGMDDGWLRVSAYLTSPRHLRMSIWRDERAQAVVSLDPDEAHRLGHFLLSITPRRDGVRQTLHGLRTRVRAHLSAASSRDAIRR